MPLSDKARTIADELTTGNPKLGDIKKRAAEIKVDHELAAELWSSGKLNARLLATLIFDKKQLSETVIDMLAADLLQLEDFERDQLTDWLLANQFMKDKKLTALMETWEDHPGPIQRRLFWYHQVRLRWTGQTPPPNSSHLMDSLEAKMAFAEPGVQWAMNFCACQIGLNELEFRDRCLALGEKLGLYKGEHVSKGCTPFYLPEFIRIVASKRARDYEKLKKYFQT